MKCATGAARTKGGQENLVGVLASSFCAFVVAIMSGECASHADVVVAKRGQAKESVGHGTGVV